MESELKWYIPADCLLLKKAVEQGDLFIGSTDTVLGLMGAVSPDTIKEIDSLKQRKEKPYLVLVDSIEKVSKIAYVKPQIKKGLEELWPAPVTVILPKSKLAPSFVGSEQTVAVRIPNHLGLCSIIKDLPYGLLSTSANISGEPVPYSFSDVSDSIKEALRFYIEDGQKDMKASTIIDLTGDTLKVIREGTYPIEKIEAIFTDV
ncbi:MAG: L-threonylcarbamoyladenylate synthase [Candidatus Dependentiae bacterium]